MGHEFPSRHPARGVMDKGIWDERLKMRMGVCVWEEMNLKVSG